MQILTDIRIYTGTTSREGDVLTATSVRLVNANLISVKTSEDKMILVDLPMGVCECETKPMPQSMSASNNGGTSNVKDSVLTGVILLDKDVLALKEQVDTNTTNIATLVSADATLSNRIANTEGRLIVVEEEQTAQGNLIVTMNTKVTSLTTRVTNIEKKVMVAVINGEAAAEGNLIVEEASEGNIIVS